VLLWWSPCLPPASVDSEQCRSEDVLRPAVVTLGGIRDARRWVGRCPQRPGLRRKTGHFHAICRKSASPVAPPSLAGGGGYATGGAPGGVPSPSSPPFIRRRR